MSFLSKSTSVVVSMATTSTDIIVVIVSLLRFSCVIDFTTILLLFIYVSFSINYFGIKNQMFLGVKIKIFCFLLKINKFYHTKTLSRIKKVWIYIVQTILIVRSVPYPFVVW